MMSVMIGHNDHIIDDDTERHSYPCQSINMNFYFQEIIENKSNQHISS